MMLVDIKDNEVEKVYVSRKERLYNTSSSLGNQIKWKHGDMYVKLNCLGYEDIAEVLVSHLMSFTNLQNDEYLKYYSCLIYEDGVCLGNGCYSFDFTENYSEVTVANLLDDNLLPYSISYEDLRVELYDIIGFDIKSYIDKILSIDSISRNEDRHFRNISFLVKDGIYKPAPIYDNGDSCMSDLISHPLNVDFITNIKNCFAKPFMSDYKINFVNNIPLVIDYNGFFNSLSLSDDKSIRALKTIEYGLKEMEGIAWVRK